MRRMTRAQWRLMYQQSLAATCRGTGRAGSASSCCVCACWPRPPLPPLPSPLRLPLQTPRRARSPLGREASVSILRGVCTLLAGNVLLRSYAIATYKVVVNVCALCREQGGSYQVMRVEVALQGATLLVVVTEAECAPPPLRIDNRAPVAIMFHQVTTLCYMLFSDLALLMINIIICHI